jgi:multimeric flavodoxin WrbA
MQSPFGRPRRTTTTSYHPWRVKHLGVIHHSRGGSTGTLCQAAVAAAGQVTDTTEPVELRVRGAFDAGADDVLWADALVLATPAHFGYMSGALKDFFERIYRVCLDQTVGLPYALIVKGDTDVDGAVSSVEKIATGLRWTLVLPPVTVVGAVTDADRERAADLGATVAAGLGEGIF